MTHPCPVRKLASFAAVDVGQAAWLHHPSCTLRDFQCHATLSAAPPCCWMLTKSSAHYLPCSDPLPSLQPCH